MRKQLAVRFGALILAFGMSACSGNRAIDALPAAANGAAIASKVSHGGATGTLVLALPLILAPSVLPSPGVGQLSSGTRSIAGTFGKNKIAPIALTAKTPGCLRQSNGLACTLRLQLPSGNGWFSLQAFGKTNGKGLPLATSIGTAVEVDPSVDNYPNPIVWKGIIRSLGVAFDPPEVTVTIGKDQRTVAVSYYGIDASGAMTGLFAGAVLPDGTQPQLVLRQTGLQRTKLTSWPDQLNFNGEKTGKLTFTLSQKSKTPVLAPASATLVVRSRPGVAGLGTMIVPSADKVVEFAAGATGATTPLRTLYDLQMAGPYGADAQGNFWMGNRHYSNDGKLLGTIAVTSGYTFEAGTTDAGGNVFAVIGVEDEYCLQQYIVEYAAGDYSGKTIRKIPYGQGCTATAIALDPSGFIYVYTRGDPYNGASISKWPANVSGNVKPLSSISVPFLSSMISDASGNLYAVTQRQTVTGMTYGQLLEYVSGSTYQEILLGVNVAGFTMDSAGNVYAEVPTSATSFQLEEFPPNSTTPSNTVSSPSLTTPSGILVVP
jgi:hypothetical protein